MSYQNAKTEVERLIERFARLSARNRRSYNEPTTRQEFILPLFQALGWNIEDTREVNPEEQVSRGYVDFSNISTWEKCQIRKASWPAEWLWPANQEAPI